MRLHLVVAAAAAIAVALAIAVPVTQQLGMDSAATPLFTNESTRDATSSGAGHTRGTLNVAADRAVGTNKEVRADSATTTPCDYGWLCVHYYNYDNGQFYWVDFYTCGKWVEGPPHTYPTWYINNQTPGTRAEFYWSSYGGDGFTTPGAFSKGALPIGAGPWFVWACNP